VVALADRLSHLQHVCQEQDHGSSLLVDIVVIREGHIAVLNFPPAVFSIFGERGRSGKRKRKICQGDIYYIREEGRGAEGPRPLSGEALYEISLSPLSVPVHYRHRYLDYKHTPKDT